MSAPTVHKKFESTLNVRPDDIDLYRHVHSTRYLDYAIAGRVEQWERDYKLDLAEVARRGLGWFIASASIEYLHPLGMRDSMIVRTWTRGLTRCGCKVGFEIERVGDKVLCCEGTCDYVLVTLADGRPLTLPEDIRARCAI